MSIRFVLLSLIASLICACGLVSHTETLVASPALSR